MQFFRSTLNQGASWHAWMDAKGHVLWPLPAGDQPGAWREALPHKPVIPHGNGLHAARWRAMAYWFGPMNFCMETDEAAQKEQDYNLNDNKSDIIACRRARLVQPLPSTRETWQDLSLQCAGLVTQFPKYYNYEGRYDERAAAEAFEHPGAYPVYQRAKQRYDWQGALDSAKDFLVSVQDESAITNALRDKHKKNVHDICRHLDLIETQKFAHGQSIGRCEEYEYHSDAMVHGMAALTALKRWFEPWQKPDTPDANGYEVMKTMVPHIKRAYSATGGEQHRLMSLDSRYTMTSGLGPLLADLPYLPEAQQNPHAPADLAGRAVMLKMGEFFAAAFGVTSLFQQDMAGARPLGPVFDRIVTHQRNFSLD